MASYMWRKGAKKTMAFDPHKFYYASDSPEFMVELGTRPTKTALGYAKDYLAFFQANYGRCDAKAVKDFLALDRLAVRKLMLSYYAQRCDASPATLARIASALRAMVAAARLHGATTLAPEDIPRPGRKPEAYRDTAGVSTQEMKAMLAAASDARDKALLMLLGALGLRRGELAALRVGDYIRLAEGGALMVAGKGLDGQKERIPVPEALCAILDGYLEKRGKARPSDPLFLGRCKKGISEAGISYVVKTLGKIAGVAKEISPHRLRHTAATMALDAGLGVDHVQALMRHKSPSTTRVYDDNKKRYDGLAARQNVACILG
jgi:integrase/recombinase XerC